MALRPLAASLDLGWRKGNGRRCGRMMILAVESSIGHGGEDTPQRIWLGRRAVCVVDVIDRWLAPDHRYFKVKGDDGATYILRHDVRGDAWELVLFESGFAPIGHA